MVLSAQPFVMWDKILMFVAYYQNLFNMKSFGLISLFILTSLSSKAQDMLRLEDAIQQGLQNQYSIQILKKREIQAANDNSLGNAGFLPTITGTATKNYTISGLDQEFFGGLRAPLVQSGVN